MSDEERYVLVSLGYSEYRGYVGFLHHQDKNSAVLRNARSVDWCHESDGMFGVACWGPRSCESLSPAVARCELYDVDVILDVSPEAREAIEELAAEKELGVARPRPFHGPKKVFDGC